VRGQHRRYAARAHHRTWSGERWQVGPFARASAGLSWSFARLTGILADLRANIVETAYDRAYHGVKPRDTAIDITMETRGPAHIAELLVALSAAGYTHERIL